MNKKYKTILLLILYCIVVSLWIRFCIGKVFNHVQEHETSRNEKTEFLIEEGINHSDLSQDDREENKEKDQKGEKKEDSVNQEKSEKEEDCNDEKNRMERWDAEHTIRVLIKTDDGQMYHDKILFRFQGEELEITEKSMYFNESDHIKIALFQKDNSSSEHTRQIQICNITRNGEHPCYSGCFEIYREEAGLLLVNEVSLEEYVKGVLPGEMPPSYPAEALKAQAICARTYACMKKGNPFYPEWNIEVDDSTACQVYGYHNRTDMTDLAVDETRGVILLNPQNELEQCYYYSTSCGISAPVAVWHGEEEEELKVEKNDEQIAEMNREFRQYITQVQESHLEKEEPFYRWSYIVEKCDRDILMKKIEERIKSSGKMIIIEGDSSIDHLGKIKSMRIVERLNSSVADCLEIHFDKGMIYIWGEYNIRYVLAQSGYVKLQDGSDYEIRALLPSAFIVLELICNKKGNMIGYSLTGGGFGHGVGMSQNGAKHMAKAGNSAEEILKTYYSGCKLGNIDDY